MATGVHWTVKFNNLITVLGVAWLLTFSTAAADPLTSKEFTIVDGNRLEIGGQQVRLAGIVAPSLGQECVLFGKTRDCGLIARSGLADLTAGATVICHSAGTRNAVATHYCTADGYDLSEGMVYTGWAVPLEDAPRAYWRVLKSARTRPRGFWRGTFVEPWVHAARAASD